MDFQRRLTGLQEQMARHGIAMVVCGPCGDFRYLTGLADADAPAADLFVPQEGSPVLVVGRAAPAATWIDDVRTHAAGADLVALMRDLGGCDGQIALGDGVSTCVSEALRSAAAPARFRDATGLMDHLRMIKEGEEIERLRAVARLTDDVLAAVIPQIREGVTQGELEAEVELQGRRLGASGVSFSPAVIFTKSGSQPSHQPFVYPRDEGLVAGVSIAFDIGFVKDGYCSDFGRSLYFGPADRHVRGAHEALHVGMLETAAEMRDGSMRLCDVFPTFEKVVDRLGYGDFLRARLPNGVLGHNIGVDVHENPWINPDNDQPLRANMVMAVEPKLWHCGEYYLRVEDMVLVGADGSEFLTNFSREVFQL